MKILYHHRIASKDGQSVHVHALIAALEQLGNEVYVASPPTFDTVDFGYQARPFVLIKRLLPRVAYEVLELGYNFVAFYRLAKAYRRFRPDLIYERYNLFMIAGIVLSKLSMTPIFLE